MMKFYEMAPMKDLALQVNLLKIFVSYRVFIKSCVFMISLCFKIFYRGSSHEKVKLLGAIWPELEKFLLGSYLQAEMLNLLRSCSIILDPWPFFKFKVVCSVEIFMASV